MPSINVNELSTLFMLFSIYFPRMKTRKALQDSQMSVKLILHNSNPSGHILRAKALHCFASATNWPNESNLAIEGGLKACPGFRFPLHAFNPRELASLIWSLMMLLNTEIHIRFHYSLCFALFPY